MEVEELLAEDEVSVLDLRHVKDVLDDGAHVDDLVPKPLKIHTRPLLIKLAK